MHKVLVTGGCGFIGASLVRRLLGDGASVRILDDLSRGRRAYLDGLADVEFVEGDIRDRERTAAALAGIDTVVHLAAFGSVVDSVRDPDENFSVNAEGTLRVLEAGRDAGIERLVFSSTGGALIGNAPPPVDERSVPRPISPYGASKLCGEAYCSAFAGAYGMNVTALRFANVIGPYSGHKKGAVTAFMKALFEDRPIEIYGDGSATRDFLYVDDLCDGIVRALGAVLEGFAVMHLASGREVTVRELAETIKEIAGKPEHEVRYLPRRAGEVERNFADYSLAKRLIGFEPRTPLRIGLEKTWTWFSTSGF